MIDKQFSFNPEEVHFIFMLRTKFSQSILLNFMLLKNRLFSLPFSLLTGNRINIFLISLLTICAGVVCLVKINNSSGHVLSKQKAFKLIDRQSAVYSN